MKGQREKVKPRKRIKTAVIGVGYLGKLHVEKYALIDEAELVGVVDSNPSRAKEIAEASGTRAFPSHRDLFGLVDAVSVVTPTESHCGIGLEFLSRGVDVLMEKPIAISVGEADELIGEAERKKAILQVGHLERFNAAVQALEGRVEGPFFIETFRHSAFPNRGTDVDVILDLMIHDIDIVLSLVKSEIEALDAVGMPVLSDKTDICNARLKFRNGCIANLSASRVAKERVRKLNIVQNGGFFYVDYANQHLTVSRLEACGGAPALVNEEVRLERNDALLEELKAFVRSCSVRGRPLVSGAEGRAALEVASRIQRSLRVPRLGISEGAGL